ncbi:MAG: hypothetical protein KKF89_00745 [Nanoarchaeota archaeon]|nr:hypothetical protein [Nanoarchaeota archaeon]MBU1854224.1 hypothetical protein [Nanoarchaeota archaeon]
MDNDKTTSKKIKVPEVFKVAERKGLLHEEPGDDIFGAPFKSYVSHSNNGGFYQVGHTEDMNGPEAGPGTYWERVIFSNIDKYIQVSIDPNKRIVTNISVQDTSINSFNIDKRVILENDRVKGTISIQSGAFKLPEELTDKIEMYEHNAIELYNKGVEIFNNAVTQSEAPITLGLDLKVQVNLYDEK